MAVCMENQCREFVRAVSPSIKKGISALNALTISLLDMDKGFVTKSDSSFREIRSAIESANQNLSEAETVAVRELEVVDKCHEELIVRKENLSAQQKQTNDLLSDLKLQQKNNKATLEMYKKSSDDAMRRLREARDGLWHQQRAVEEAQERMNVGIGITFIPIFGWIAGPLMMDAAETDISNAHYRVEQAESTVRSFESSVHDYCWRVSNCTNRIQATCNEIAKTQDKLREIRWDIERVLIQRNDIAGFQEKMRNSVKVLGCLAGTSSVAEMQTRCFVLLEAMIKLMQNFVKLVEGVREDRLIREDGIMALITNLQVNYVKMQRISVASETTAIEDYL